MDDAREELNQIDRLLAEALDVDASPDFAARVRQRIAAQPARAPWWSGWRIVVPLAVATAAMVAIGIAMYSSSRATAPQRLAARPIMLDSRPPTHVAAETPMLGHADRVPVRPVPRTASRFTRPTHVVASIALAGAETEVAEVLIPREDIEIYRRLIALAGQTPPAIVVDAQPVTVVVDRAVSDIRIDPIRIELMAPPVGAEGDRQ